MVDSFFHFFGRSLQLVGHLKEHVIRYFVKLHYVDVYK